MLAKAKRNIKNRSTESWLRVRSEGPEQQSHRRNESRKRRLIKQWIEKKNILFNLIFRKTLRLFNDDSRVVMRLKNWALNVEKPSLLDFKTNGTTYSKPTIENRAATLDK